MSEPDWAAIFVGVAAKADKRAFNALPPLKAQLINAGVGVSFPEWGPRLDMTFTVPCEVDNPEGPDMPLRISLPLHHLIAMRECLTYILKAEGTSELMLASIDHAEERGEE